MKLALALPLIAAATLSAAPVLAYDADWKRGRIYYRAICSSCHTALPTGVIQPNGRTKAEWSAYMKADKHAKGKEPVSKYISKDYLESIKASNKAADTILQRTRRSAESGCPVVPAAQRQGWRIAGQLQLICRPPTSLPSIQARSPSCMPSFLSPPLPLPLSPPIRRFRQPHLRPSHKPASRRCCAITRSSISITSNHWPPCRARSKRVP
jgi:hypothetical protein